MIAYISLTECNSGTIQKLPFRVNTLIELKNVTTTYDNTGTLLSWNIQCKMPYLCYAVSIFFSSIVVLTPNTRFFIVPLLHSVSYMYYIQRSPAKIRLQHAATWSAAEWPLRRTCYLPAVWSFGHVSLTVLSFPQGKIRREFKQMILVQFFLLSKIA